MRRGQETRAERWSWRKAFGVSHWGTAGSQLLHTVSSYKGAAATRGREVPDEVIEKRIATRKARGYPPPNRWAETGWMKDEIALLGTMSDKVLARKIGRTRSAVRACRVRKGIPPH